MAPKQAQHGEANSDEDAMPLDRLTRVMRAARLMATGWPEKRRQNPLIYANRKEGSALSEIHDVAS